MHYVNIIVHEQVMSTSDCKIIRVIVYVCVCVSYLPISLPTKVYSFS